MRSEFSENMVTVRDPKAITLNEKSHYGTLTDDGLQLSLIEAFFLMEKDKIKIYKSDKKLKKKEMGQILHKNRIFTKYLVFKDLRNRGYIVRTGFKYGSEFRLYERGTSPGDGHSNYLVKVITENSKISASDFSSYARVAHGVNKKLLLAVVDEEGDITYYNIEWMRP